MKRQVNNHGFTILEMLIAMTVFSVMLLLVGGVFTQLSRQFYKGLVRSRTQEKARSISEEIATNIQFSGSQPYPLLNTNPAPNNKVQGWCIADRRYMYILSRQLGDGGEANRQSKGVLMRGGSCTESLPPTLGPSSDPDDKRVELIGDKMRLASFEVTPDDTDPSQKVWRVSVRVVYGDNDLICSPMAGDCDSTDVTTSINTPVAVPDLNCKNQAGSQYCSAAQYDSVVARRL